MKSSDMRSRRQFVRLAAGAVAVPFFAGKAAIAGGHLPKLTEDDPQAVALAYKHDTNTVDGSAYPTHSAENKCSGCSLYKGKEGAEWGECSIFPGKEVAAEGWCTAFVPKA